MVILKKASCHSFLLTHILIISRFFLITIPTILNKKQLQSETLDFCRNTARESISLFIRILGSKLTEQQRKDRDLLNAIRGAQEEIFVSDRGSEDSLMEDLICSGNRACSDKSYKWMSLIAISLRRRNYLGSMLVKEIEVMLPGRSEIELQQDLLIQFYPDYIARPFITAFIEVLHRVLGQAIYMELLDRANLIADRYRFSGTELLDWEKFYSDPDMAALRELTLERLNPAFNTHNGRKHLIRYINHYCEERIKIREFQERDLMQLGKILFPDGIYIV